MILIMVLEKLRLKVSVKRSKHGLPKKVCNNYKVRHNVGIHLKYCSWNSKEKQE